MKFKEINKLDSLHKKVTDKVYTDQFDFNLIKRIIKINSKIEDINDELKDILSSHKESKGVKEFKEYKKLRQEFIQFIIIKRYFT